MFGCRVAVQNYALNPRRLPADPQLLLGLGLLLHLWQYIKHPIFRVTVYVSVAAIGAMHAGERLETYTPAAKQMFGLAVTSSAAAFTGSTIVMNTILFETFLVTPPSDSAGIFQLK